MEKNDHRNKTWETIDLRFAVQGGIGDPENINVFDDHFSNFEGKILEIGAGTGFFANDILKKYKNIEYTILDLENHFPIIEKMLHSYENINYIPSHIYEKIFDTEWDMLISTYCLSETPEYYYENIFKNIKTKECFILEGNIERVLRPHFRKNIEEFMKKFTNKKVYRETGNPGLDYPNLAGGQGRIPHSLFIGKK